MITFHSYEGKNLETLKATCINELNTEESKIYFNSKEVEGGLFKGKKVVLETITEDEILNSVKEFIKDLSKLMNIEINSEVKIQDGIINIILVSENNNNLIGKDGKILNALQLILRQTFSELNKFNLKISLDIGNYRAKKVKNLEREIKNICKEVNNTKVEVKLDPMNSYERRIVHSIVSDFENLQSESVGEEPNRYTIIRFKD